MSPVSQYFILKQTVIKPMIRPILVRTITGTKHMKYDPSWTSVKDTPYETNKLFYHFSPNFT